MRKNGIWRVLLLPLLTLCLLAGCAAAPTGDVDTSAPETSAPASSLADTSTPDAAAPDTSRSENSVSQEAAGGETPDTPQPENSASQEAAGGETPPAAYRPSAWQQEVAQRQQQWTVAERIDAAVEPYNADDCKVLRVNLCGSYDDLTEEQKALMPMPASGDKDLDWWIFLTEDGRPLYTSLTWGVDKMLWGQYGGDQVAPAGDMLWWKYDWFLVYEGDIPESGLLNSVRIRDLDYRRETGTPPEQILEGVCGRQAAMREHFEELAASETDLQLIGYDEAMDAILRRAGWQGFEKATASNGAVCYTNGEVYIYPHSCDYEHYRFSACVGDLWSGAPAAEITMLTISADGSSVAGEEGFYEDCRMVEQTATIDRFIPEE